MLDKLWEFDSSIPSAANKALREIRAVKNHIKPEWRRGPWIAPKPVILLLLVALALTFGVSGYRMIFGPQTGPAYLRHPQ